jgi:hypothetical protein
MAIGPREAAHREHKEALEAQALALKQYGRFSETFKQADARLTEAISKLPPPVDTSEWK